MYIVEIKNGETVTTIHGLKTKLKSGEIIRGINSIDSFTLSMHPDNPGFSLINEFTTHVTAYNTNKDRYDFIGRVLYANTTMDETGSIVKTVTCESVFGYLCDSVQTYFDTQNWTVAGMLQQLIDCHNSQVEEYKQFKVGVITQTETNDNIYEGIQRENTWDSIKAKLIDKIGGEIQYRVEDDGIYIDYLERIGEVKTTPIALSVNMKSITREQDPTSYVTRLIPLGCKLTDENGEETEQRLDITTVTDGGVNYIDDETAIELYGIHVAVVEFDDITNATYLMLRGQQWMGDNNHVNVKYTTTALDLSLLGYDVDDFQIGNTHPLENSLIGIDDAARITKQKIDVCEEAKSTFEVGDNVKSLSDIQREQTEALKAAKQSYQNLQTSVNNQQLTVDQKIEAKAEELEESFSSQIEQLSDSIKLEVSGSLGDTANILLTAGANEYSYELDMSQVRQAFADDETAISISAGLITFNAGTLVINSTKFTLDSNGVITATGGTIGAITLSETGIYSNSASYPNSYAGWYRPATITTLQNCFFAGASDAIGTDAKFLVTYGGALTATDATINGVITTEYSSFKAMLDGGGLGLYFDDVLCGTINTKYWTGAATEGISLRVEEGGNYIMFSHADDTQGSGYTVDYYLNAGWSSNYDEMHIFQTSARFLDGIYVSGPARLRSLRLFGSEGEYLVGIDSSGNLTVSAV